VKVNGSLVRDRVLTALDLWLIWDPSAGLRAVLRAADPDKYRDAVRDALAGQDGRAVFALAGRPEALTQPARFAVIFSKLGDVPADRRRAVLQSALRARPGDLALLMGLGLSYTENRREEADEQVRWFQAAVAAHPRNVAARNNLGVALSLRGDRNGAIACFQEAIGIDPTFACGHCNLGGALWDWDKGNLDRAIACFREAIRHNPKDAPAHHNLGNALLEKGDPDAAIAYLKKATQLDPMDAIAHNDLGFALEKKGDTDGAIACYKKATQLNRNYALAHLNLGALLCDVKRDYEGAITSFNEAIRINPQNHRAHFNLGNALQGKRDLDGAIAAYRKAVGINPNYAEAHVNLGNVLRAKGDPDGAIAAFREAIRLNPKNPDSHTALAWLLATCPDAKARHPDQAVTLARKAVHLAPKTARYWNTLGVAHYRAGDWEAAVAALDKVGELSGGGDASTWLFLAMAHRKLGNPGVARKLYKQAVQWLETNRKALENDEGGLAKLLRDFQAEAEEVLELKKQP
jgi:tetratricopeptide (TPR) repeat protein